MEFNFFWKRKQQQAPQCADYGADQAQPPLLVSSGLAKAIPRLDNLLCMIPDHERAIVWQSKSRPLGKDNVLDKNWRFCHGTGQCWHQPGTAAVPRCQQLNK
jgi:hypothetical protein